MYSIARSVITALIFLGLSQEAESQSLSTISSHSILFNPFEYTGKICEAISFPDTSSPLSVFGDSYSLINVGSNPYTLNYTNGFVDSYNGGNQSILLDCEPSVISPFISPWISNKGTQYGEASFSSYISPGSPINCTIYNVEDQASAAPASVWMHTKNYTASNEGAPTDLIFAINPGESVNFLYDSDDSSLMQAIAIEKTDRSSTTFLSCYQKSLEAPRHSEKEFH